MRPFDKPTLWVRQMAVVKKPNGKIRICIDPRVLHKALLREHPTLPTMESMLHNVKGFKVFFKDDLRNAYWQVHSSHLLILL